MKPQAVKAQMLLKTGATELNKWNARTFIRCIRALMALASL
jgi:hypothetical protein